MPASEAMTIDRWPGLVPREYVRYWQGTALRSGHA
jgi:hypothetical protein